MHQIRWASLALSPSYAGYAGFASISPLFRELRSGHAEVTIRNRRKVHNHLGTVNAIAMCAMWTRARFPPGAG